jgi:hypothetical protein
VCAATWNGGSFILEVMPRQVVQKEKKKLAMKPIEQVEHTDDASGNHQQKSEKQSQ